MEISVGIPMMFLDRTSHFGNKDDKHGNLKAVVEEAIEDENGIRKCNDPDYQPELTKTNKYYGVFKGLKANVLCDYYDNLADNYKVKVKTKAGVKERGLRKDADIAFAMIVKPSMEDFCNLTNEQKEQFLDDSWEIMQKIATKYGVVLDIGVLQNDEREKHLHIFGHDEEFRLSKKLGLKFHNDLNHGMYVSEMRAKGWNIAPKKRNYLEDTKNMNEEELKEYKDKRREERKMNGRNSTEYKLNKEMEKNKELQEKNNELQKQIEQMRIQQMITNKDEEGYIPVVIEEEEEEEVKEEVKVPVTVTEEVKKEVKEEVKEEVKKEVKSATANLRAEYNKLNCPGETATVDDVVSFLSL